MTAEQRWWVAIQGSPAGPWTKNEIQQALYAHQINHSTLVCPVGGQAWSELQQTQDFAHLFMSAPPTIPPLAESQPSPGNPFQNTNPYSTPTASNPYAAPGSFTINAHTSTPSYPSNYWPGMAQMIGTYCLFVASIYHGLFILFELILLGFDDSPTALLSLITIPVRGGLLALSIVCGLKWQSKNRSAVQLTIINFVAGFAWFFYGANFAILEIANSDTEDAFISGGAFVMGILIFLSGFVFLIWKSWLYSGFFLTTVNYLGRGSVYGSATIYSSKRSSNWAILES